MAEEKKIPKYETCTFTDRKGLGVVNVIGLGSRVLCPNEGVFKKFVLEGALKASEAVKGLEPGEPTVYEHLFLIPPEKCQEECSYYKSRIDSD